MNINDDSNLEYNSHDDEISEDVEKKEKKNLKQDTVGKHLMQYHNLDNLVFGKRER